MEGFMMRELYEDLWLSGGFEAERINQVSNKGYCKYILMLVRHLGFPYRDCLQGLA